MSEQFGTTSRYTGAFLGLAAMSVVSIVFMLLTREPKNNDLQTVRL